MRSIREFAIEAEDFLKLPRPRIQLNDEQQLALAILLVILVAISILYCLGFASLILRENWDKAPSPLNGATPSGELYREGSPGLAVESGEPWLSTAWGLVRPNPS